MMRTVQPEIYSQEYFTQQALDATHERTFNARMGRIFTGFTVALGSLAVEAFGEGGQNVVPGAIATAAALVTAYMAELSYYDASRMDVNYQHYTELASKLS